MIEPAWRLASAWQVHAPPFDNLHVFERAPNVPAFDVGTGEPFRDDYDVRLGWSELATHPNVLVPLGSDGNVMTARYAPIEWSRRSSNMLRTVVRWGRQLVDVFTQLGARVPPQQLGVCMRPVVTIDVGQHVRVGFLPLHDKHAALRELPKDIAEEWPACESVQLAYIVGRQLKQWNDVDDPRLRILVHRACDPKPRRRFASLRELDDALAELAPGTVLRSGDEQAAWQAFDEGAGWLALEQAERALACFEQALQLDRDLGHAAHGVELAAAARGARPPPVSAPQVDGADVAAPDSARGHYVRGKALLVSGRLVEARDAFEQATRLDPKLLEAQLLRREVERVTGNVRKSVGSQHAPTFDVPPHLAELRDVLVAGNTAASIEALRAARYAEDADAQLLLARFLAFDRRFEEALAIYDALVATTHRTAALVGKGEALLALGKPGDALAIFEQLPDDVDAAEGAARALAQLGRTDEAAQAYRRFIALASSGSDLRVRAAQLWLSEH